MTTRGCWLESSQKYSMNLTEEQRVVVEAPLVPGQTRKVVAGAGTGKSTMLEELVRANSHLKFLYLGFNRSVRERARGTFPSNANCQTFNSLAYGSVGRKYENIVNNVSFRSIRYKFKVNMAQAASIRATLDAFLNSREEGPDMRHVFVHPKLKGCDFEERILDCASELWKIMVSGDNKFIRMTHSGCLKLFQKEAQFLGYDSVLGDEFQDVNPVCLSIIERQLEGGSSVVLVGDPRQQIYSWRGAVDAMQNLDCEEFRLTNSFRFGKQIAWMANKLLSSYGISLFDLNGVSTTGDKLFNLSIPDERRVGSHAVLSRTNVGAFSAIIELMDGGESVAFNGDINVFTGALLDIFNLKLGRSDLVAKKGRIGGYDNYSDFLDVCQVDSEMNSLNNIMETFKERTPEMIERINDGLVRDIKLADSIVTTAHKAKGGEFDSVTLWDDFPPLVRDGKMLPIKRSSEQKRGECIDQEELHLSYVAVTRAKTSLALSPQLKDLVDLLRNNPSPGFFEPDNRHASAMAGFYDGEDEGFENEH